MWLDGQKTLKQRLHDGKILFGTFFKSSDPCLAEMLGFAGLDFIIIDAEHSVYSYGEMQHIVRIANGTGMNAVVRTPSGLPEHILHACDMGAQGVQVPNLKNMEEVKAVVDNMRFYPAGHRGFGQTTRAARYSFCDKKQFLEYSNNELLCVIMAENLEMVGHLEELCNTPYVDVVFIGPSDLSQALGKPGQTSAPEVLDLAEKVAKTVLASGKKAGMYCATLQDVSRAISWGIQYIAYSSELSLIANCFKDNLGKLQSLRSSLKL